FRSGEWEGDCVPAGAPTLKSVICMKQRSSEIDRIYLTPLSGVYIVLSAGPRSLMAINVINGCRKTAGEP
ncbi:hypothetical protein A2U01_0099967, partial [Trifolium medium]|nr:hypothetical protein [Trifolium medium]